MHDELIVPIHEDTKTINLLNRFEEYDLEANPIYQCIVVKNTKFWDGEYHVGYNLVIERADPMCKCVGVYISSDYLYNPDKRLPFAKPRNWATEV